MKRKLLHYSLLTLFMLVVWSGNVWATDVTYTISEKNKLTTTGTAPTGSSATIVETYTTSCQMTSGNSQTLTLKGYNGYKITALKLSMRSNASKGGGKLSINDGTTTTYLAGTESGGTGFNQTAWHGSWSTSYVDVIKSSLNISCGEDDVIIKIEATANSLYCQSYTITYEAEGPKDLTNFTFDNTTPSVQLSKNGSTYEASYTQDVTVAPNTYDGTISYSIDYENSDLTDTEAIIDDETGEVLITRTTNTAGELVVKASASATSKFNAANTTYTLTVNAAPAGVGTPTFDVATGSYYYGEIVKITSLNAEKIYYTTDGTVPSKTNGTFYDDAEGIVINKTMTVKAIGYDGETASEVASIDYTLLAPETPTISIASGNVTEGTTVELTMGNGGVKVVYTTDGSTPTAGSTEYTSAIVINNAMTLKAATVDAGDNLSTVAEATYAIVINKEVVLWEEDFSSYEDAAVPSGGTYSYVSHNGGSDTKVFGNDDLAGGTAPEILVGKSTGYFQATIPLDKISGSLDLTYRANYNRLDVTSTTTGVKISEVSFNETTKVASVTISEITEEMTSLVLKFANTNSSNCRLDDIKLSYTQVLNTEPITISASKYNTYASTNAMDFSSTDVKAYTAKVSGDDVVLTEITGGIVPANTGVIVYSETAGTFNIPVTTTDATVSDNELVGVTAKKVVPWEADGKYNYILQKDGEGVVKFFKATGASLKANRAYLCTAYNVSAAAARGLNIVFADDMTTGIREKVTVNSEKFATAPVYNLNGQRVAQPTRGLYIVNGKKVLVP